MTTTPAITGIGSVTPYGVLSGLVDPSPVEPTAITSWTTSGFRRAFQVAPFRPAAVVPGLNTRRLDRFSGWAMVASSLALRDAAIEIAEMDRSRVAVVLGTGFGCVELTHSFFRSAAANGWGGTDPICFPETLANSPAAHVALFHGLRGPNITVGAKGFCGEVALLHAASLLRHGQADLAIVLAGDALTRAVYEWYETANFLDAECFNSEPVSPESGFVPSEGVVAMVVEPNGGRSQRCYARIGSGTWRRAGEPSRVLREFELGAALDLVICAGAGAPCSGSDSDSRVPPIAGAAVYPPQPVATGLAEAGGLFHLLLALGQKLHGNALLLGISSAGFAAIRLELP